MSSPVDVVPSTLPPKSFLESLAAPGAAIGLETGAAYNVPPNLNELIERIWGEPSHRVPISVGGESSWLFVKL
eukprot:4021905-Pyramimonas_sp.AAC.1